MSEVLQREKQITRTSVVGIIVNVFLSGFKALVGFLSGSIAIVLDALNNLTDALSSVITIIGIKLAKKKPDNSHPFGYGRIEYFSAVLVAGIVLAAGVTSLTESVRKIIRPEMPEYSLVTVVIVAVAVAAKIILGRYTSVQGKKYHSDALSASGADSTFDAVISASTLVGIAVTLIFNISVDGWIGTVIALFIIKAGIEMLGESVSNIMGNRPDSEITKSIKTAIRNIPGVLGAYDLVLHDYGPDHALGSVHIEIPADMSAENLHRLTKQIQLEIKDHYHVFLTVGIYAVDAVHTDQRERIDQIAKENEGVLGTHGIFIDDGMKYISFDVLTDFTVDREALRSGLTEKIKENYPEYRIEINFDTNYSD